MVLDSGKEKFIFEGGVLSLKGSTTALDIRDSLTNNNGIEVRLETKNGLPNQKWDIVFSEKKFGKGWFQLRNAMGGLLLQASKDAKYLTLQIDGIPGTDSPIYQVIFWVAQQSLLQYYLQGVQKTSAYFKSHTDLDSMDKYLMSFL